MSFVFGPVPSRRLGRSLGIDPLAMKTCNFSCVYCQLGRTRPLVTERCADVPVTAVADQAANALEQLGPEAIDWITFVGSGETTLHSGLGTLIRQVKTLSELPIAVITNGSLLHLPAVRQDLQAADAVLPSLDAGSPELFRLIARPHPACTFERLVAGLVELRQVYTGRLWLEVMLLAGVNDTEQALTDVAQVAAGIEPDEIHLAVPSRPPAETWVRAPDEQGLERARAILGSVARIISPGRESLSFSPTTMSREAVLDIITRHPMRLQELETLLDEPAAGHVSEALAALEASGRAQKVERHGVCYWAAASAYYPRTERSEASDARKRVAPIDAA
jgi:wyosine [tRNA(Phe)-imidazoG37] synthetase (radical SAM superfamily)